jgi:peptidoglycan hydrolase CwlO-like protein|tara:strand:- start:300 stop:530 length:231 start_codon:yes stop_codon:yes gene_type:complete
MTKKDKGPNDLEQLLEQRDEEIDMLNKQKEYMQKKCREAGAAILDLEFKVQTLVKDIDRISEERDNFVRMLGDGVE